MFKQILVLRWLRRQRALFRLQRAWLVPQVLLILAALASTFLRSLPLHRLALTYSNVGEEDRQQPETI